ncbi:glycosyltransferase family 4 protein [Aromatoleum anaerobium]|uniref:Glycosyltransferase n=1 Tax=Aromatoleum anaerobium TaxID=182180 RepID=A0ABX1PIN5_9RHOO|nr:glycosyltransferase family 4 protein [Aromatoleum anaerobium]MCK0509207.1 glycosyltransferase family 4 protein [Aromatoleum anaerobium]
MNTRPVICFITGSHGDWGGASRVLYTNLRLIDTTRLEPLLLLPGNGPIVNELEQCGLRHLVWGQLTEPGNPLAYLRAFFRALAFFRRERVAVIHVNHSNFWRPAELLAAWVLRIPIVAHYHVINARPGPFMRLCRAAVSVSHYTADHSLPAGLERPVIYNPINLDRFDAGRSLRAELGLSNEVVVVSFLGQIREVKGVHDFIAMAKRILTPNAHFLIAGECRDPKKFAGSYSREDLRAMIGDDERIGYLGYVARVEDVYCTSDVIVMPSRWQEPLGLISLEAGACRKPVVATRVGGIPEAVHDGVNGFLVEAGDVAALAERVESLIGDAALRQKMGEAGRRRIEAEFTTLPVRQFEDLLLRYCSG